MKMYFHSAASAWSTRWCAIASESQLRKLWEVCFLCLCLSIFLPKYCIINLHFEPLSLSILIYPICCARYCVVLRVQCVFLGSNWIELGWFTYTSRYMPWGRHRVCGFCIKRGAERHYSHCTHSHRRRHGCACVCAECVCVSECEFVVEFSPARNWCNAMPKFNSF